jgi:hypothetical protein
LHDWLVGIVVKADGFPTEVTSHCHVKRENNRGNAPNWGIIYVYMKMSQLNLVYG